MFKDFPLIKDTNKSITQFYPHIPKNYMKAMKKVFSTRWVGQGPLVDRFEDIFSKNLPIINAQLQLVQAQMPCIYLICWQE